MCIKASISAWGRIRESDLAPTSRLVLLALAERLNGQTGQCNPSIKRLADDTGLNRKTVLVAIRGLEENGFISVQRRNGAGSHYVIIQHENKGDATFRDGKTTPKNGTGTKIGTGPNFGHVPVPKTGHEPGLEPGSYMDTREAEETYFAQESGKAFQETKETVQQEDATNPKAQSREKGTIANREAFDLFYQRYPKKRGKADAAKAWRKLNPDPQLIVEIMARLETAMASHDWLKEEGQYIPHAATWINNRRWEDEIHAAKDWARSQAKKIPGAGRTEPGVSANQSRNNYATEKQRNCQRNDDILSKLARGVWASSAALPQDAGGIHEPLDALIGESRIINGGAR